ncbi:MAG: tetratricopeptide repeat protein [Gammaproteobacteria bacterium]|nr:tetratricopeptide repeat protein [Gammaproteobacteria bacterium]
MGFNPVFAGLLLLFQIGFAIHAVRTGKDSIWLWIIVFVPGIGCLLYFVTQLLPEITGSRTLRKAKGRLVETVDPERELRRCTDLLAAADTVANRLALADQYLALGRHDEAIALYQKCLGGLHENDPGTMEQLAHAYFGKGSAAEARATLEELMRVNPRYKSMDGHLLYARILEALNETDAACVEYEILRNTYAGEEARVRYGLLLQKLGREAQAKQVFDETLTRCKRAPKHYQLKEQEWIRIAERTSK